MERVGLLKRVGKERRDLRRVEKRRTKEKIRRVGSRAEEKTQRSEQES